MNLTRMTQLDPIDPLPPLGRKVEPPAKPGDTPTERRLPNGIIVGTDGKMRTDLPEPPALGVPAPAPAAPKTVPTKPGGIYGAFDPASLVGKRRRLSAAGLEAYKRGYVCAIPLDLVERDLMPDFKVERILSDASCSVSGGWFLPLSYVELAEDEPQLVTYPTSTKPSRPMLVELQIPGWGRKFSWFDGEHFNGGWKSEEKAMAEKFFFARQQHQGLVDFISGITWTPLE